MLRFVLAALLLTATAAQAETYSSADDFLRKTSGFDPMSDQAGCYADAVGKSMGPIKGQVTMAIKGNTHFPKKTREDLETMLREKWRARGASTLADLVHLSCPITPVDKQVPIDNIYPLKGLPE